MDPLRENETMQQFMKLLAENGREGQAADLSQLMWYMDGMNRQFDELNRELQDVKAQLAQEKQPAIKKIMQGVAENLEEKVQRAQKTLANLRERIAGFMEKALDSMGDAGFAALDKAVSASLACARKMLGNLHENIVNMIGDTRFNIARMEDLGQELRSAGGHLKNAGRALTGLDVQTVDGGQEGRLQSAVLAPMRGVEKLLVSMNNATLATIGKVEDLERPAEVKNRDLPRATHQKPGKRLAKKPSIRQELAARRAEVARAAPAPEHEKAPEATR